MFCITDRPTRSSLWSLQSLELELDATCKLSMVLLRCYFVFVD